MCLTNDEYMLKVMSRFFCENAGEGKALHAMQHVLHLHCRLITASRSGISIECNNGRSIRPHIA